MILKNSYQAMMLSSMMQLLANQAHTEVVQACLWSAAFCYLLQAMYYSYRGR